MSEWRVFRAELTSPKSDVAVLLVTFFLTVFVDLTVAIEVGMVVAAFLFMRRMAEVTDVRAVRGDLIEEEDEEELAAASAYVIPRGVEVFEINGPFFFGAAETFKDTIATVARKPKVFIIRLRRTPAMDATGLHTLTDVVRHSRRDGTLVLLAELPPQPLATLRRSCADRRDRGGERLRNDGGSAGPRTRGARGSPSARSPERSAGGSSIAC
jgi:SulP family sulfate permease